jgi:hypothetical protein
MPAQRHQTLDRLGLLCHPHRAHAALADLLEQLVRADHRTGARCDPVDSGSRRRRSVQQPLRRIVRPQQSLNSGTQRLILLTCSFEKRGPLGPGFNLEGSEE